jgi:thiol-disulfide isomerase/thioredoxin
MKKFLMIILFPFFLLGCNEEPVKFVSDERGAALHELSGKIFRFSDYKGKWIILNYWASWCEPCRKEIPELIKFAQMHSPDEVVVIGVNYDFVEPQQVEKFVKAFGITYPTLINDPAAQLGIEMVEVLPTTFVIDPTGKIIAQKAGEQTALSLDQLIENAKASKG